MSDYLDPENEELLKDFFIEAEQQVETMERNILAIESNPRDHDSIDELFRAAHTLKGGGYTVQMEELAHFTHKVEDLLDEVRSDKLEITPPVVDLLLDSIDVIKGMFEQRMAGGIYTEDTSKLEQQLITYTQATPIAETATGLAPEPLSESLSNPLPHPSPLSRAEYDDLCQQASNPKYRVRVHFDKSNPMNTIGGVQEFTRLKDVGTIWLTHPDFEEIYEDNFFEYIDFYLESTTEMAEILKYAMLLDVTLDVEIDPLNEEMAEREFHEKFQEEQPSPEEEVREEQMEVEAGLDAEEQVSIEQQNQEQQNPADVEVVNKEEKKQGPQGKRESNASVLRVDSRRIDEILNLVSEAVINKATFNQVSGHLNDLVNDLRLSHLGVRDKLNAMIEELLLIASEQDLRNTNDGLQNNALRGVRKKLQDQAVKIHMTFDPLENQLKTIIGQFANSSSNLARNTNDLHEAILSMRMVPINQVFSRFPRLVRDLSRSLDKKVELVLEGEETEIDKSVAEELIDPLMHCVRNSMDHGIEDGEERLAKGKPEEGTLRLSAINEGSNVIIEVSDDGGGIDIKRVRKKALDNGVINEEHLLTDQEAFNLIFDPGFSTARAVTNISGRGVGLDVVKKQIEKLNGTVNVWSESGKGTRFSIRLPLTLAIIQGLLVRVHSEVYAIPITAVIESIRITREDIHLIDNCEVISVRDDVISLLSLNRIFQLGEGNDDPNRYMFVVVVGIEERRVGLMVDNLIGEEDVVIKPLVDSYTHSPGVAGATILGDGTVSLILDVSQLLDLAIQFERFVREQKRGA